MRKVLLFVIALSALASSASSDAPKLINAFGVYALDANVASTSLLKDCAAQSADKDDTSYVCPDGLEYFVYYGAITAISYDFTKPSQKGGVLGIRTGDNEAAVVAKIAKRYGITLHKSRVENWNVYGTEMIKVASCGQKCSLAFVFDKDGFIRKISKQPETPYI